MGYMHIDNLYKNQTILMFRECFALEKIHGTSANLKWKDDQVAYFSGGEKSQNFIDLFDNAKLVALFLEKGHSEVTVYGEAYGGKQQGQSWRYGKQLKFIVFEVQIGDSFLSVDQACEYATFLGLEFVYYKKIPTDIASIDIERDAASEQAKRNGVEGSQPREGVVLRPLIELRGNNDGRVICKHKRDEERETKSKRDTTINPAKLEILQKAEAIAEEWVTPTRLEHVLDKLGQCGIDRTPEVIQAMTQDVIREAASEIVDTKDARKAIGAATAKLFKSYIKNSLYNQ